MIFPSASVLIGMKEILKRTGRNIGYRQWNVNRFFLIVLMKKLPKFHSESEEQDFWSKSDSTDYINWNKAKRAAFYNLKPSLKTISLRLPETMIEDLKHLANRKDVPYQSLIKIYLAERIGKEMKS